MLMSNSVKRVLAISRLKVWLPGVAAILLALLCAALILATSTPLPMTGWGRDTVWGGLLVGWPGHLVLGLLAATGLSMSALAINRSALALALPLLTLLIAAPPQITQDEGLLNSFLLLEETSALLRSQISEDAVAELVRQSRNDEATAPFFASTDSLGWFNAWSSPENYAFDAWLDKWRTDGEPQALALIALDTPTFENAAALREDLYYLQEAEMSQIHCIDDLRMHDPDFNGLNPDEFSPFADACPPAPDLSAEIAALQDRIDAAEELKRKAGNIQNEAEDAARSILEVGMLEGQARERQENWRRSLAVSLAITGTLLIAALCFDKSYSLPLITSGLVIAGHFGVRLLTPELGIETANGHFVALHGTFLLALYLAARIVRAFVVQNADIWLMLRPVRLAFVVAKSLGWWSGLALATCGGVYFGAQATNYLETVTYGIALRDSAGNPTKLQLGGQWLCEDETQTMIVPASPTNKQLEADIDNSVRCYFAVSQAEILQADAAAKISDALKNPREIAGIAFDRFVPGSLPCSAEGDQRAHCISTAFDYPDCSWYHLLCKLRRMPHVAADRAYGDARARLRMRFLNRVIAAAEVTAESATATQEVMQPALAKAVREMSLAVRDAVAATFRTWDVINAIGALVFTMAVVKSFGFVLARVLFDEFARSGLLIAAPYSKLRTERIAHSDQQSRRVEKPGRYYVSGLAEVTSVAPTGPWLWKPWKFAFARFPSLTLLNRFTCTSAAEGVHFTGINAQDFVRIDLIEGAEVAFTVGRLLAFSNSLKFRRVWSFRLTHLVLGRASMAVAKGPGVLYLCSFGAVRSMSSPPKTSFSPDRLLAWQPNCGFTVKSTLTIESIYMGGITIGEAYDQIAIYDAKGYRAGLGGAIGFIPMLLLPF